METKLRRSYALKTELYTLSRQLEDTAAQLAQGKYDQRQAKAAILEYEGSFRAFLDKLSGRQESRAEALRSALRRTEAALSALTREKEALELQKHNAEAEFAALPPREDFLALADPKLTQLLHRLDAALCLKQLAPELEENHEALLAMRDQLQGRNSDRIMSTVEIQDIYSRPDIAGEKCRKLLERLEADLTELGIDFPMPAYFRSPSGYLHALASDALRRDRVNLALDQVLDMKKQTRKLLQRMEDEHG